MSQSPFRKTLHFIRPYRLNLWLNVIFNIFYAIFNVLSIVVFIPTLGVLFDSQPRVTVAPNYEGINHLKEYIENTLNFYLTQKMEDPVNGPVAALVFICILSITIFFLKNLFRYAALYVLSFVRAGMIRDLQNALYSKLLGLPMAYFGENRKGDLLARMTSDIKEIEASYLNSLETLIREPLSILFVLVAMLVISIKLTLFVFIFLPIAGFIISALGKRLKSESLEAQRENGIFLSLIEETLGGLRIIKGFNAEKIIQAKFEYSTNRYKRIMQRVFHRTNLASPVSEFLGVAVVVAVVYYGGSLVLKNESTLEPQTFFGYIGLFYTLINPVKSITTVNYSIKKGNAAAERIFEVLETDNPIKDPDFPVVKDSFEESIKIDNVSFHYEKEAVLKHLTLQIKKGQTVALVGQSGSGKSTLTNLLLRFYDVTDGSISIDGIDIRQMSMYALRNLMGIVTQDSILFNDTVKNNLLIGNPNATDEEIRHAAKVANAHDFIMELPLGYDTSIGDGGNKLSGGQKQRLSIARAVLKNPPIMILDEATSALDTESEQLVQKALENMMKDRTSVVIAHRLSTIQNADLIAVLNRGRLVELGTHQELLTKAHGVYKKLVQMQSFN